MHIIGIIVGAVALLGFWYWRLKAAREATSEIVDAVGTLKGAYNRKKFRGKAEASTLAAIEDPAVAAAVFLVCLAEEDGPLSAETETRIAGWLADVAGKTDALEVMTFARWAAGQTVGAKVALDRLLPLLRRTLGERERADLLEIAAAVAAPLASPAVPDVMRRLRAGLKS